MGGTNEIGAGDADKSVVRAAWFNHQKLWASSRQQARRDEVLLVLGLFFGLLATFMAILLTFLDQRNVWQTELANEIVIVCSAGSTFLKHSC